LQAQRGLRERSAVSWRRDEFAEAPR
jgi:hypothetical protein